MSSEDDTFRRLQKPSWDEVKAMKPFAASPDFFEKYGWTWEEFKNEWTVRIKRQQEYYAAKARGY